MLSLQARVDLGVMVMKGYSSFPKPPTLLEPRIRLFSVISRTFIEEVLPLCREAVSVFYSPRWLAKCRAVSMLLYGSTTWTLKKHIEKKLDGNDTRMMHIILNKSLKQHPTKKQLYGHLPPISKPIQIRWTKYVGHCWRCKDELISDIL